MGVSVTARQLFRSKATASQHTAFCALATISGAQEAEAAGEVDVTALAERVRAAVPVGAAGRPTLDDVERISQGRPARRRGTGSRAVPHRLNQSEREEWQRAQKRTVLEIVGSGYRRGGRDYSPDRVGNPLVNIFRQWCDARARPAIILRKATLASQEDVVVVDASPLRMLAQADYANFSVVCDAIAAHCGVTRDDAPEDSPLLLDPIALEADAIWRLPIVTVEYHGPRQEMKEFSKTLSTFWNKAL